LLASRSVDVMRPAAQPLLQVAASGLALAAPPAAALFRAALRCASSARSHLPRPASRHVSCQSYPNTIHLPYPAGCHTAPRLGMTSAFRLRWLHAEPPAASSRPLRLAACLRTAAARACRLQSVCSAARRLEAACEDPTPAGAAMGRTQSDSLCASQTAT